VSLSIRSNAAYLAVLAVASGLILLAGVVFRPKHAPVPTMSEAERVQLQNLAQRQALQRRNVVLADYARDLLTIAPRVLQQPDSVAYVNPQPGEMLIVLGVVDSGAPQWITVEFAGYSSVKCGSQTLTEINVDSTVPPSLEHAVVFTLRENVVGTVTGCNDRLIVTDPKNYAIALRAAAEQRYLTCCGVRFSNSGIVVELRVGSILHRAGVEVGDRILSMNGQEITSDDVLKNIVAAPEIVIDLERSSRKLTLRHETKAIGSGAALERASAGSRVINVDPGSPAAKMGFRVGDIVTRAGDLRRPAPPVLEKLLASSPATAIVVVRGDTEVLLEPPR
jgi:membrane-associated protease RseP (regulator of RpoE activity)